MSSRGKSSDRATRDENQSPNNPGGFYDGSFTNIERSDLAGIDRGALDEEIDMLRVSTRRVFELANGELDLGQSIETLRALGLAATRLSSLLRSRRELQQSASQAIQQALHEVIEEMNLS
jgi:hypothetical protein